MGKINTKFESYKQENDPEGITALPVDVFRNSNLGDSTNNGLTSKVDSVMLVFDSVNSPFKTEPGKDYLVLIEKKIGFSKKAYKYAVPKSILDKGYGYMFGGNFIYSSDSRFPNDAPIKVHDRVER